MLNQGTDVWSTVSDCTTFSTSFPMNTAVLPGCIFGTFQLAGQGELYYIKADPTTSSSCTWNDPQVLPQQIANATNLSILSFCGPQPELSGQDFRALTMLSTLRQDDVSFTVDPIWPNVTQAYYYHQTSPVAVPPQHSPTSSLSFTDSVYQGSSITSQAHGIIITNSSFPMGLTVIGTGDDSAVLLTDVTSPELTVSVSREIDLTGVTVIGDVQLSSPLLSIVATSSGQITVDAQALIMTDVTAVNLVINFDIRYLKLNRVIGNLSELHFIDWLIGMSIKASPDLVGMVAFPAQLSPVPTPGDLLYGVATVNTITIQDTQLTGVITFPEGVTMFTVTDSGFTGTVPDFDAYPDSLTALDLRNNYLTLCTGYPAMGPKVPNTISAGNVLLYPQNANVSCYCIAGNCLSGNGFPAHYEGTPAVYQSVDCISTAPVENTYCLIGFWSIVGNYTVAQGQTLTAGTGLAVKGDLTLQPGGGISYILSDNPVQVQGTLELLPSSTIQVEMDDDYLTGLRGKGEKTTVTVPLIRSYKGVSGDVSGLGFSQQLDSKSCNKVTDQSLTVVKGSLAAIMTIDGSKCKGPSQWSKATIIGVTVGIVVGVVGLVVGGMLLVTFNRKVRNFIRPYTARNEGEAPTAAKV